MAKENQPRRFELDPRATAEVRQEQLGIIQDISTRQAGGIRTLFGEHARYDEYEQEGITQIEDRGENVALHRNEAEIRATQLSLDPTRLKNAGNAVLLAPSAQFVTEAQVGVPPAPLTNYRMSVTVDYTNAYWIGRRNGFSETDLARDLEGRTQAELLAIGVTIAPPPAPLPPPPHPFHAFTQEQAIQVARRARVPFLRGKLAGAGVGEFNIRLAQKMLMEDPDLVRLLGPKDQVAEQTVRAKQLLADLVHNRLGKISGESFTENYSVAQLQLRHIEHDLRTYRSGTFSADSDFFQTVLQLNDDTDVASYPRPELDAKIRQAIQERERLSKACNYYRKLRDILGAIYTQAASIQDLAIVGTGPFADVFTKGAPWTVNDTSLSNTTNPVDIQRDLIEKYKIKKSEEYEKDIPKRDAHGATPETAGVKGVLDVFKNYYERRHQVSPEEAVHRAYQTLMENELSAQETQQIEREVEHLAGKRLIWTSAFFNGVKATLRSVTHGSQEAYVCRLAESVGVPVGVGTASQTRTQRILEYVTSCGKVAAVGAGVTFLTGGSGLLIGGVAAAGVAGWAVMNRILRRTGYDRTLFGTRTLLGYGPPRWGARPSWGEIANDRHKLKVVWDGLRRGIKEGKLQNTWYVQGQLKEVSRLLLPSIATEAAEDLMEHNFSKDEQQEFNMQHWRRKLQEHIGEVIQNGFTGEGKKGDQYDSEEDRQLQDDAEASMQIASQRQGGKRRAVGRFFGPGGGFWKWWGGKG